MLNLLSILIGLLSLPLIIMGWIPFLGWSLWFALLLPVIGTAIGALSSSNSGRNFNLILIVLGGFRLFLGGGLF